MYKLVKILLLTIPVLFLLPLFFPTFAQDFGPGPAGVPQLQYLVARLVCIAVPAGFTAMFCVLVIAGFKFLLSAGEAKAVASANLALTWAFLGVLFMAIAWLILLLIQNVTGAKVTEFNLATLPGVQGFTGSCWAPPPQVPNSTLQSSTVSTNQTSSSYPTSCLPSPTLQYTCQDVSGYQLPIRLCKFEIPFCDDSKPNAMSPIDVTNPEHASRYLQIAGSLVSPEEFDRIVRIDPLPTGSRWFIPILYRNPKDIAELGNVLNSAQSIFIMTGTKDDRIFHLHEDMWPLILNAIKASPNSEELRNNFLNVMYGQLGAYEPRAFGMYERNKVPSEYLQSRVEAELIVRRFERGREGQTLIIQGLGCSCGDYYNIRVLSPLVYIYPKKTTTVSLRINSAIISTILATDNNSSWHVVASPNGTLTTLDGKKHKFIPYEFLRNDFKRPEKGIVIAGSELEGYLKSDLWKKLGLAKSEINDYWKDVRPRVPQSPYYFVSLIERSEIDRVLPMEVNPKPDTIIRNMTYILPLSSKPNITPQPLEITIPNRQGFTVLENGVFVDGF